MKQKIEKHVLESLLVDPIEDERGNFNARCPWCDHESFGISFIKKLHPFNCYRKKNCGVSGNIFDFLKFIERMDLIEETLDVQEGKATKISSLIDQNQNNDYLIINNIKGPPEGFKRLFGDDYLDSRGISDFEYELFSWGNTEERKLKDYRFVLIEDFNNNQIGYIGRSIYTKEEIKKKEERLKEIGINAPYPRYKNSKDTEFAKLFFGEKEIVIGKTKEVILVEGIFDKTNISKKLDLYNNLETKCLSTYGAKISEFQIKKLLYLGIKSIILLYDPDFYQKLQKTGFSLEPYFDTKIGICPGEKDPGDLNEKETEFVFNNLTSSINVSYARKIK